MGDVPSQPALSIKGPEQLVDIDDLRLQLDDQERAAGLVPGKEIDRAPFAPDRERHFRGNAPARQQPEAPGDRLMKVLSGRRSGAGRGRRRAIGRADRSVGPGRPRRRGSSRASWRRDARARSATPPSGWRARLRRDPVAASAVEAGASGSRRRFVGPSRSDSGGPRCIRTYSAQQSEEDSDAGNRRLSAALESASRHRTGPAASRYPLYQSAGGHSGAYRASTTERSFVIMTWTTAPINVHNPPTDRGQPTKERCATDLGRWTSRPTPRTTCCGRLGQGTTTSCGLGLDCPHPEAHNEASR